MADSAGQAVSSVLHANADEKTDLDLKLDSIEHDNSASSLAGVKTGVKNRVAIRDASSPFLMDEDEEQDMLFRRGSRRPDEDDEQDGREAETPGASPPANTADNERPLGGNGVAASSAVATAAGNATTSKGRGRGRPRRSTKPAPSLFKDNELYNSSRAASPVSSLDGQAKLRRNAPRLSVNSSLLKKDDQSNFDDAIPDINMLPPSSPPPQLIVATEPGHTPLKPYDASPRSIFRPPPSAALEIFNKPPSPSFRLAFRGQTLAEIPMSGSSSSLSSLPSSSSGISAPMSGEPTPLTAVSSSLQTPVVDIVEQNAGPSRLPNRATTPQMTLPIMRATRGSLVSTDTSPYAIKKVVVKTGVRKGKAKKGIAGASAETEPNNDFCSACNGIGRFLCCDGCPRSFHFMCLEPPLEVDQLPEEDEWFCKQCVAKRIPRQQRTSHQGMFAPLLRYVEKTNPTEFRLPDDIRTNFANVQTAFNGAYVDNYEQKPVKFDRSGFPEEKDFYKLKSKGKAVICFRCKGSAAPMGSGVAAGVALGRRMISCDYCSLHWHLDCLDPPPPTMPHPLRKWMCPNHAQQLLPKKRTLRTGVVEEVITRPGVRNNGIIEVLDPEAERKRMEMAERFINGKRYKIPEKIIHLDFWKKIGQPEKTASVEEAPTTVSIFGGQSPLSSVPSSPVLDKNVTIADSLAAEMTDEQLDPVIRALLRLAGRPNEEVTNPVEDLPFLSSGSADPQHGVVDGVNTAGDQSLPALTGPLDAESLAFFDDHTTIAAELNLSVSKEKPDQQPSEVPIEARELSKEHKETSDKFQGETEPKVMLSGTTVTQAVSDQSGAPEDLLVKASPEDLPIQAQPSSASAMDVESPPVPQALHPVSPLKPAPPQISQRASVIRPIVSTLTDVAKRSAQSGRNTGTGSPGRALIAETSSHASLRQKTPMLRTSSHPKPQPLARSPRAHVPQTAVDTFKLRKIAPSAQSAQPNLILQPSENVASPHTTLQSAADALSVTPAKRTATQAVLTQHSGRLGLAKQRQIAPKPVVPSAVQGHGPLQAYSNPVTTRSEPSRNSGLPNFLAQGTEGSATKITLKLPGQTELSARLASVQAQVSRQSDSPTDPDLDPYLDRFLAGLSQSPVPSPGTS